MIERRQHPPTTDMQQLLRRLPADVLLGRMPDPVIGVGHDGVVAYANPAATSMLGYDDGALIGRRLESLLAGRSHCSASECLALLRSSDGVIEWHHAEGFSVRTSVSTPLLLRATDPFLMICITDVTELHWSQNASSSNCSGVHAAVTG